MKKSLMPARLKCPSCGSTKTLTLECRGQNKHTQVRRRRGCQDCHHRFTTAETYAEFSAPNLIAQAMLLRKQLLALRYQIDGIYDSLTEIAPGKLS